jgi:hypothetical protein
VAHGEFGAARFAGTIALELEPFFRNFLEFDAARQLTLERK